MVTIHDIAARCGVSASTVSRALSGSSLIPQNTRQLVRQAADELGYIPNAAARSLKTKRSDTIGVISFIDEKLGFSHYLFAGIFDHFVRNIEKEDFGITLLSRKLLDDESDLVGYCYGHNLGGVLILCADTHVKQIQNLLKCKIPIVVIDSFDSEIATSTYFITSNNRALMFELVDYAASLGHRDMVFISGQDIFVTHERVKGFIAALKANDIEFKDDMLVESRYYNNDDLSQKLNAVLERKNLPSCIFLPDDYSAIIAYDLIKKHGLVVGRDISVVGFDGLEITQQLTPRLTTAHQDVARIGECAAQTLMDAINGIKHQFLNVINGSLIKGESVAKIDPI